MDLRMGMRVALARQVLLAKVFHLAWCYTMKVGMRETSLRRT